MYIITVFLNVYRQMSFQVIKFYMDVYRGNYILLNNV